MSDDTTLSESSSGREIVITGRFDRPTIAHAYHQKHFQVGDVLISRKKERFTVAKIYKNRRYLAGKTIENGTAIDLVGSKKGKVFTIYVR
jgi:hypothetical protein